MAGPPPVNLSLQDRLIRLAQTLQFAWFVGHVSLLLAALRYALSYLTFNYYSRWAKFSYRTAFVAAGVTYGIVVYKGFRARTRQGKPTTPLALLGDENVQYLGKSKMILLEEPGSTIRKSKITMKVQDDLIELAKHYLIWALKH